MLIQDARGSIDCAEAGSGTTLVFVPGSFATPAAWRGVIAGLQGKYRIVTTSLLGYGATAERRTAADTSLAHELDVLAAVAQKAGGPLHLVAHSYGGLCSLALALSGRVPLASMTLFEPNPIDVLWQIGDSALMSDVRALMDAYFADHAAGEPLAARRIIDFYGGAGAFDAMPERARQYVVATTAANVLDWKSAAAWVLPLDTYSELNIPTAIVCGANTHPAVRRIDTVLAGVMPRTTLDVIDGASHFLITTHPAECAARIESHVAGVLAGGA